MRIYAVKSTEGEVLYVGSTRQKNLQQVLRLWCSRFGYAIEEATIIVLEENGNEEILREKITELQPALNTRRGGQLPEHRVRQ